MDHKQPEPRPAEDDAAAKPNEPGPRKTDEAPEPGTDPLHEGP